MSRAGPPALPEYVWLNGPARAAAASLAAAGLALAFPEPGWWPLAVPSLGLLFALWTTAAPRRAFQEGFVAGLVFYGLLLRWFAAVLLVFTSLGGVLAAAAVVGAGAVEGLMIGAASWTVAHWTRRHGRGAGLVAAVPLWIGLDALRVVFPLPFPWGTLAASWARSPVGAPAAALVGSAGLSLLLALGAALVAMLAAGPRRPALGGLAVWSGVLLSVAFGGRHITERTPGRGTLRVAVVQASMPENGDALDKLGTYERLTREAAARGATLVIWPESAVPYRIDSYEAYRQRIEALARSSKVDLVLGSITTAAGGGYHNSNALVRADVGLAGIQPKRVLVPFGEYLPLRFLLGNVPALAWELGDDLLAGPEPVVLEGREAKVGALVCYEAVFPGLAADLAGRGVELLANTTNDSWFGWTAGSWQHLQHALLRAAETGRPLARAANSGISALVTRRGAVVAQLGLGERGLLVADLELGSAAPPGAVVGPGVARACAIVAAVLLAIALYRRFSASLPRGAGLSPPPAAAGRGENPARAGIRKGIREGIREGTEDA